jgi:hypothetical protein
MSFEVQGVAMSLSGLGRHDVAIRLASVAKTEWARLGVDLRIRFWDALTERYLRFARRALGDRVAARVCDEGKAIPFDDAMSIALSS